MKKVVLYLALVVVALAALLVFVRLGKSTGNPFHKVESGSPTVTTENAGEKLVFKNYGPAPEFAKTTQWLNGETPTAESLKGKVVLINFWTYSCISCVRLIPLLNEWQETYQDQGLVIIGVHTPEYNFEKVTDNLQTVINRFQVKYPVIQDNNYAVWEDYNNQFWPANYLIDREGKIVYARFGDGGEDLLSDAINRLTGLPGGLAVPAGEEVTITRKSSQTIAFGFKNPTGFASAELPTSEEQVYTLPETLRRNAYALEGIWKLSDSKAALTQGYGRIRLSFNAAKVQLLAQSIKPVTIKVTIDRKTQTEINVQDQKNYELFSGRLPGKHILEIEIPQPGFEASQFVFE
jgi:thiol-disulfide isomerase/thioredoxin